MESNTQESSFFKAIDKVLRKYNAGGYEIEQIECDGEFKPLLDTVMDNMDIRMNYTNAQEHVGVAERNNRTLKEAF